MDDRAAHVQIGEYRYRLAEGLYQETGLRPMRRRWRSLFAERNSLPGRPGYQNVRTDDLRWVLDSWAGGEGQRVIDGSDQASFRRFELSNAIDLSNPGELRLSRAMTQEVSTGQSVTTYQGDTWIQDVAPVTIVGTDARLDAVGAAAKRTVSLAAGNWQIRFYAYCEADSVILGSAFLEEEPRTAVQGTAIRLKTEGALVRTVNQSPGGPVDVTLTLRATLPAPAEGAASAELKLLVWDQTQGEKVAETRLTLRARREDAAGTALLTFRARAGRTYRYKVRLASIKGANWVAVEQLEVALGDARTLGWQVRDPGNNVVASGTADLRGVTASKRIAATVIGVGTSGNYTLRVSRDAGGRRIFLDRAEIEQVTVGNPRVIELGKDSRIWLADASRYVHYWKPVDKQWVTVGQVGTSGQTISCLAHTDDWEFVGVASTVWRVKQPSTAQAYTNALADPIVGLAVSGKRLHILTESSTAGTILYDCGLEKTPTFDPTLRYQLGNKGIGAPPDLPQRIAPTRGGVVFFTKQGPDAWVHEWDGAAGFPVAKLPVGFDPAAIVHGNGLSFVAGGFPVTDSTGTSANRPAVFLVDHGDGRVEQLPIRLHRDGDPPTKVVALQMYGADLWVLTQVDDSPPRMRLWRVSLRDPLAAFCEHAITLDETQASGAARGLAITGTDLFALWSIGGPYRLSDQYETAGAVLRSSRYGFQLAEPKRLDEIEVSAQIPSGCSVEVWFRADEGDWELAGVFTEPGRTIVSGPERLVTFRFLQLEIRLYSADPSVTPIVYSVDVRGYLPRWERQWELLLACFDEQAVWRIDGQQARGVEGVRYLWHLAESGAPVEMVDRYSSSREDEAATYIVTVQDPDVFWIQRGEAYVRVTLAERD